MRPPAFGKPFTSFRASSGWAAEISARACRGLTEGCPERAREDGRVEGQVNGFNVILYSPLPFWASSGWPGHLPARAFLFSLV